MTVENETNVNSNITITLLKTKSEQANTAETYKDQAFCNKKTQKQGKAWTLKSTSTKLKPCNV